MRWVIASGTVAVALVSSCGEPFVSAQRLGASPHQYFESLLKRPELVSAFALRTAEEVVLHRAAKAQPAAVHYLFPNDPYPGAQDAAKVEIPAFVARTTLAEPLPARGTTVVVAEPSTDHTRNRHLRVGDEILKIVSRSDRRVEVERGQFGTPVSAHAAGTPVALSTNSLINQVWLPIATTDGATFVATWDAWYGAELRRATSGLATWKTFQFEAPRQPGGRVGIWFEVRTRFDLAPTPGDIGIVDGRTYSTPKGPNVTKDQPLAPMIGTFTIRPETWVRYWFVLDQRKDDWDLVSLWVADRNTPPVQLFDRLQVEAHSGVGRFRFEYNTSQGPLGVKRGPLVSYVRNFVLLKNIPEPRALMQQPTDAPGAAAAPPPSPTNLRILQ